MQVCGGIICSHLFVLVCVFLCLCACLSARSAPAQALVHLYTPLMVAEDLGMCLLRQCLRAGLCLCSVAVKHPTTSMRAYAWTYVPKRHHTHLQVAICHTRALLLSFNAYAGNLAHKYISSCPQHAHTRTCFQTHVHIHTYTYVSAGSSSDQRFLAILPNNGGKTTRGNTGLGCRLLHTQMTLRSCQGHTENVLRSFRDHTKLKHVSSASILAAFIGLATTVYIHGVWPCDRIFGDFPAKIIVYIYIPSKQNLLGPFFINSNNTHTMHNKQSNVYSVAVQHMFFKISPQIFRHC